MKTRLSFRPSLFVCMTSFILLLFNSIVSATDNVVKIGDGTTTDVYLPIEPYYEYSYSQSIYLRDELLGVDNLIDSISYHFVNTDGIIPNYEDDVKIYMGLTNKNSFASVEDYVTADKLTLVYDGKMNITAPNQVLVFHLDEPFVYDLQSNLVIAFEENTKDYHLSDDEFYCHSNEQGNLSVYYYYDNGGGDDLTPEDPTVADEQSISFYRPNIQLFSHQCALPFNVTAVPVDLDAVSVSFSDKSEASSWIIEYGGEGFSPDEGTGAQQIANDTLGTVISNLPNGPYKFYVRGYCENSYSHVARAWLFSGGGLGTVEKPYLVSNLRDLHMISQYPELWNCHFKLTADIDATGTRSDVVYNNNGLGFRPIGNSRVPFTGSFNGKGHTISNLYINRPEESNVGLLGTLGANATLTNLGLINPDVAGSSYVGGLVGYSSATPSTIINIQKCFVDGGSIEGKSIVGALIGYGRYCFINACFTNSLTIANNPYSYVGGIVGYAYYSTISQSYALGEVVGSRYAGGAIGYLYSSDIRTCYSSGKVTGMYYKGGFVGYASRSTSENCYWDTSTSGLSNAVGGSYSSISDISALTSEQFGYQSNFMNWNFVSGWHIGQLANDSIGRPRFRWQDCTQQCVNPSDLELVSFINQVATLTWHSGGSSSEIIYGVEGFDMQNPSNSGTSSNDTIQISGFTKNVTYEFYVKSVCNQGESSYWSGPHTFTTYDFAGGQGTPDMPFLINSFEQLHLVSKNSQLWNSHFMLINDIDAAPSKTSSVYNNNGAGFSPIGNTNTGFTGCFNGNKHCISNLFINRQNAAVGFFGSVKDSAQIQYLGLENPEITGDFQVGGIAGTVQGTSETPVCISHCYTLGGKLKSNGETGGLVGWGANLKVDCCYSTTEILGGTDTGGLVGIIDSGSNTFSYCYASGRVVTKMNNGALFGKIGGCAISNLMFDKETSQQSNSFGSGAHTGTITALNSSDFYNLNNFSSWDFETTWVMGGVRSDIYVRPRFKWQKQIIRPTCLPAINVSVTATGSKKATVSWINNGPNTNWLIEHGPKGFQLGSGVEQEYTSSNKEVSDTIIDLPDGIYDIYVTPKADSGDDCDIQTAYNHFVMFTEGGIGSASNPYKISNMEDLNFLTNTSELWANSFLLNDTIDASETKSSNYYNGLGFNPIGTSDSPFVGSFDGDGKVIKSLYINNAADSLGFFGKVGPGAVIRRLGLLEPEIIGGISSNCVGALVGHMEGAVNRPASISECYSEGGSVSGDGYVGGLCGFEKGSSLITNSYTSNTVSGNYSTGGLVGGISTSATVDKCYTTGVVSGNNSVGALIGHFLYATCKFSHWDTSINPELESGFGTETSTGTSFSNFGLETSSFNNTTNFDTWSFSIEGIWEIASTNYDSRLRPRLQMQDAIVQDCSIPDSFAVEYLTNSSVKIVLNSGAFSGDWMVKYGTTIIPVTGSSSVVITGLVVGGSYDFQVGVDCKGNNEWLPAKTFVMFTEGGDGEKSPYKIANASDLKLLSFNPGIWGVNNKFEQTANIDASTINNYVPIGSDATHFDAAYDGQGWVISNLSIQNNSLDYVGLFGVLGKGSISKIGVINPQFSTSNENAVVGGLVAYVKGALENGANVSNSYVSMGDVVGVQNVGGLVGVLNNGKISNSYTNTNVEAAQNAGGVIGTCNSEFVSTIQNCYAAGVTEGNGNSAAFVGVMGSAEFSNCYWDNEISTQLNGVGDGVDIGVIRLTTEKFGESRSFYNWDFDSFWKIARIELTDDKRPLLYWQKDLFDEKCLPAENVTFSMLSNESVHLEWDDREGVDSWTVSFNEVGLDEMNSRSNAAFSGEDFSNLLNGVDYNFYIKPDDCADMMSNPLKLLSGEGSVIAPYEISTVRDLHLLSKSPAIWNLNFVQLADIYVGETRSSKLFNNGGLGFSPIGDRVGGSRQQVPFTGRFNGKKHEIRSLYINRSDNYLGLFGCVEDAALISDLGLVDAQVIGVASNFVSSIAGFIAGGGILNNCYSENGSVIGNNKVGGLVGYAINTEINYCYSTTQVNGVSYLGGLIGLAGSYSNLSNCYASGAVGGESYSGGLIGYSDFNIGVSKCYASGVVNSGIHASGFIGYSEDLDNVESSYWDKESSMQEFSFSNEENSLCVQALASDDFCNNSNYFTGWDFTNVWKMESKGSDNIVRPRLYYNGITTFNQQMIAPNLLVYPNPANEYIWVESDDLEDAGIQIVNVSGQLLYESNAFSSKVCLYVGNLSSGTYFINVIKETWNRRNMIIKK